MTQQLELSTPYPDVDTEHNRLMREIRLIEDEVRYPRAYLWSGGADAEIGSSLLDDDEASRTIDSLPAYREASMASLNKAQIALKSYYDAHTEEVQSNAVYIGEQEAIRRAAHRFSHFDHGGSNDQEE